jgi:hypothetical protein
MVREQRLPTLNYEYRGVPFVPVVLLGVATVGLFAWPNHIPFLFQK